MHTMPRLGSGIALVGRATEMDQLRSALARSGEGTATAVLVSGDAGVGKSRILDEILDVARDSDALVLTGRCLDVGESGLAYLPFAEAIGSLPESATVQGYPALARLLPGTANVDPGPGELPRQSLTEALGTGRKAGQAEPDLGRLRLFEAVIGVLGDFASTRTVVLAIEDLHWADASTRELLSFLLARLRGQRLLVVATYRSDDLHRRHPLRPLLAELFRLPAVERLDLSPFAPDDSRELVSALADQMLSDPSEATLADIARRSEGNPFFAEELVAATSERGDRGLPWTLSDVLLARIEQLAPATQRVLRAASVAGRRVRNAILPAVIDLPDLELEEALREAVQHNVLITSAAASSTEEYSFRHALQAEAIYGDLLPGERVRLHAAYARQLAKEENVRGIAAELAFHSMRSNDLQSALAASSDAAKEALDAGAPAEAQHHLENALQLWDAVSDPQLCCGEDELTLLERVRDAASRAGDPERAIAYARSAVEVAEKRGNPETTAAALENLTRCLNAIDGYEREGEAVIERAWDLLRDRDASVVKANVLAMRGMVMRWFADVDNPSDQDEARRSLEDAIEIARLVGASGAEADALITVAQMDLREGKLEQANARLFATRDHAAEVGEAEVHMRAQAILAFNYYEEGRLEEACDLLLEGIAVARSAGLLGSPMSVHIRMQLSVFRYVQGDWDRAEREAVDNAPHMAESNLNASILAAGRLDLLVGRGRFEEASGLIEQLRQIPNADPYLAMLVATAEAGIHTWQGHPDRAIPVVQKGIEQVEEWSLIRRPLTNLRLTVVGIVAADALAAQARRRRDHAAEEAAVAQGQAFLTYARELVANAVPRSGTMGPEGTAWAARAEAEADRLTSAGDPALWKAVIDGFSYGHRYEQALARWRLAAALFEADDRAAAASELRTAWSEARAMDAVPLVSALEQLARRARLTLDSSSPEPLPATPSDLLTPRELGVLQAVARGLTNRQVGEELFISEKTVSVHLSRVMAKLDVTSRTEAVASAYDRGLLTS